MRVDLPGLARVKERTFELHELSPEDLMTVANDDLVMMLGDIEVRLDLSPLGA